ncbi:dual specificity mitogen-activated protein kinase kinase 6-like [Watersipora subatra]|uniref:dual specificity mitogen-activated protein kinase kinase 6-like n=1 Tax=Watersipora subatra TaxID=2589382 RepID=UPI00355BAC33
MDLNQSIKPASAGKKKKEFKGRPFEFEKKTTPEPIPRSPQIPWEHVSTLTLQGKKQVCSPHELESYEMLGKGAYGVVHKMIHKATQTTMAVKRLPLTFNSSEKKQNFMDLDVSMRSGSCPYAVKFFGAMIEEGEVWICMEIMDLSIDRLYQVAYANGYDISENFLKQMAYSVVTALQFLKTQLSVIHRDVKPSNILVNRAGEIKICDFGVSGYLENSLAFTRVGCKFYMSPERIDPPEGCMGFGIKSDVWSFGITMIEVATGSYPYDRWKDPFHQIQQVVNGPPPTIPSDKYSPEFNEFVTRCLEKQVEERADYTALLDHPFLCDHESINKEEIRSFVCNIIDIDKKPKT